MVRLSCTGAWQASGSRQCARPGEVDGRRGGTKPLRGRHERSASWVLSVLSAWRTGSDGAPAILSSLMRTLCWEPVRFSLGVTGCRFTVAPSVPNRGKASCPRTVPLAVGRQRDDFRAGTRRECLTTRRRVKHRDAQLSGPGESGDRSMRPRSATSSTAGPAPRRCRTRSSAARPRRWPAPDRPALAVRDGSLRHIRAADRPRHGIAVAITWPRGDRELHRPSARHTVGAVDQHGVTRPPTRSSSTVHAVLPPGEARAVEINGGGPCGTSRGVPRARWA